MSEILKDVNTYYSDKIRKYGISPRGVDWNSEASQTTRYEQLSKLFLSNKFSILDFGCGYGGYIDFLNHQYKEIVYTGFDISKEMIHAAQNKHQAYNNLVFSFTDNLASKKKYDYVVASGLFNVKLKNSESEWKDYIQSNLDKFNMLSTKGFSFNLLTKYSDKEFMKDYLFYADPLKLFDYCKNKFSRNIALLHDYDLYEFTIIVRK